MKKNKKHKSLSTFVVLVVMLVMICVVSISSTYAKYTTTVTGTDSAKVALWKFEINDTALASGETTYTLGLFNTINELDGSASVSPETDVKSGKIIAPGTQGSFDIKIKNASEVNATYKIDFELTGATGMNLKFSTDGGSTWADSLTKIPATDIAMGATETVNVAWKWEYEVDDATNTADTTLGVAGSATPTVTATLNLVQKN